MPDVVLRAESLVKVYPGPPPVTALDGAELTVAAGERVAILGTSGAGKSTLLNILGLLDEPTAGRYALIGQETTSLRAPDKDRLRAQVLGFVFQSYHVLGHRTVAENILLKLTTTGYPVRRREEATSMVLASVGLSHRRSALGSTLSGGEKQRLAIARAVVAGPAVLLADEPTGNLDPTNAGVVLDLFDAQAATGVAVVVITHDDRTASWADRVLHLHDGVLEGADRAASR